MNFAKEMTPEMRDLAEKAAALIPDIRESDWYDPWGTCLGWMFSMNDRLREDGAPTNATYSAGAGEPDTEAYEWLMLEDYPTERIAAAEAILDRLADLVRDAGMDY